MFGKKKTLELKKTTERAAGSAAKPLKEGNKLFGANTSTDVTLLIVVVFLMAIGVIMVYSSSFNLLLYGRIGNLWLKQLVFAVVGIVILLILSRIQLSFINYFIIPIYIATNGLLVAVQFLGETTRGAKRSFSFKGIAFQPSELAKVVVILTLAFLLDKFKHHLDRWRVLLTLLMVLILPVGLIATEDFSTSVLLLAIGGGMIFVGYEKISHLVTALGLATILLVVIFMFGQGNRMARFELHQSGPWAEADGKGRQTIQSLYAIGSGGLTGRGLGQSIQKMGKVTQAHHDIIFAIICEELGLIGGFLIILLFLGLLYRMLQIAGQSSSIDEFLVVMGVMIQIAGQVFINIGVATALLPNTGMPLPFISYGGSSLLVLAMEIGLVLGVARQNNYRFLKREIDS